MTSNQMDVLAPLASPLPPPPEGDVLTPSQWTTLMALADTIIPSLEVSSPSDSTSQLRIEASDYTVAVQKLKEAMPNDVQGDLPRQYLNENASSVPGFRDLVHRTLGSYVREDARKGIALILTTLDTRAGCLLTTGYTTSFHLQPVQIRQQILRGWAQSYLPLLRQTFKAFSFLFKQVWLKTSPTVGPVLGFPSVPVHGKPGQTFEYEFVQFPPGSEPEVIETDVVIVGSGCGGGVCAKNLAEAGHRVVVVEKAYHFPAEHLPMSEKDAGIHLFMNGGVDASDDNSISVIAGQAWGGGGTVNWSASLQTQGFVRREWAERGLSFFTSSEYQTCLDRVCHRMGVSTDHIEHNFANKVILEGSRKLGYNAKDVPQNTGGNKHYCGYCTLGCGAAEKQGPVVSWLPDAEKAGAHFIEGFDCEKVLFDESSGRKVAVGVQGTWTSRDGNRGVTGTDRTKRQVIINAKRVIVSAGTMQSPLLLLRSGLKNPQIGRNLYLHPVSLIGAIYPDEVRPWEGGILTSVCSEFENLDGHGHGAKLEVLTMLPGWWLTFQPWLSGLDFKLRCAQFKHMAGFISLARDRDTGRVYPDPVDGRTRFAYTPSAFDKRHILQGALALARINYVAGASEIFTVTHGIPVFKRAPPPPPGSEVEDPGINDAAFQAWLADVEKRGLHSPETSFGSAHQMGTCRMGVDAKSSVVDPKGKVWGVEGLYVADASVFPSASGVNPMVTNMAISDWISRGVARDLRASRGGGVESARL